MVKSVEGYFRPAALDQVFFENYKYNQIPTITTMVHKGLYQGLIATTVANMNPVYAGFYGFLRGALDVPLAIIQEFAFDDFFVICMKYEENLASKQFILHSTSLLLSQRSIRFAKLENSSIGVENPLLGAQSIAHLES